MKDVVMSKLFGKNWYIKISAAVSFLAIHFLFQYMRTPLRSEEEAGSLLETYLLQGWVIIRYILM